MALSPGVGRTPTRAVAGTPPGRQAPIPRTPLHCRVRSAAVRCIPFPDQDGVSRSGGVRTAPLLRPGNTQGCLLPLASRSGFSAVGPVRSCSLVSRNSAGETNYRQGQGPALRGLIFGTSQESQAALAVLCAVSHPQGHFLPRGLRKQSECLLEVGVLCLCPSCLLVSFYVRQEPPSLGRFHLLQALAVLTLLYPEVSRSSGLLPGSSLLA